MNSGINDLNASKKRPKFSAKFCKQERSLRQRSVDTSKILFQAELCRMPHGRRSLSNRNGHTFLDTFLVFLLTRQLKLIPWFCCGWSNASDR